jgi:hypothetical protein
VFSDYTSFGTVNGEVTIASFGEANITGISYVATCATAGFALSRLTCGAGLASHVGEFVVDACDDGAAVFASVNVRCRIARVTATTAGSIPAIKGAIRAIYRNDIASGTGYLC